MLRHHLEGARAVEGDISEIVITEDEVVVVHQPPKGKPQRSVVRVGASYAVELSQLLGRQTFAISEVKLAILDAVAANTGHLLKMPVARVVVSRSPGAESVHAIAYAAKASYTTTDVFVEWDLTSGDVLKRVTL